MDRLPLFPRASARIALAAALAALALALVLSADGRTQTTSAATAVSGRLTVPRPQGMTVGYAGTGDPALFAQAQSFQVASVSMFHIPSQTWSSYVPGAPAFANSLTTLNLRSDSIVFAKRTESTKLVAAPVPLAGPPFVEIIDQPQRFEVPPANGLTIGVSGTNIPEALIASQFFNTSTMNVWSISRQRYLTYIPGAPAAVNTLSASTLRATDVVWLKALGGATGGVVLEDTPFIARLVPPGQAGTLVGVGAPEHGKLIENGDGSVTYVPEKNYSGPDSFTYTVMTPNGPEVRTFRIEVTSENDAPIAVDDVAVASGGLPTVIAVLDNDKDPDNDPIKILRTTQPAHGIVAVSGNAVIYTPEPKFTGTDVFEYEITDGIAEPGNKDSIATVFVAVGGAALAGPPPAGGGGGGGGVTPPPGGDVGEGGVPPFLTDDSASLEVCDTPPVINVLANDAGDGVTVLVVTAVSTPTLGTAANNGDGTVTYTPPVACEGTDTFTYTVPDGDGVDQTATVTVSMGTAAGGGTGGGGTNQLPLAVNDTVSAFANDPAVISVLANDSDPDGDPLTVSAITQPSGGSVVNNGNGTVTYTANNFVGQTSFTYTASDGNGGEAIATVSVTVESAPVSPVGPVLVSSGGQVTIQVITPSSFVRLGSVTNGSHGSTTMNAAAGTVTYKSQAGYIGDDWITWTLIFNHGGTAQTTLRLKMQ